MKRTLILLAVLAMLLASVGAYADSSVTGSFTLNAREASLNVRTNTIAVRKEGESHYVLMDANGRELTTKPYLAMNVRYDCFEVALQEGTNIWGMIDSTGAEIVPLQYGDVEYINKDWQLGAVLVDATVDNYDYKSWGGEAFYLIDHYDVYFKGAMIGTLGRTGYYTANAFGDYLYIKDKTSNVSYYDSAFNKSAYVGDGLLSSEYEENYRDHSIWHRGSGQQAFVPSCTLTPDEVEVSIYCINNQFFDLQGNLLFSAKSPYDTVRKFEGDYARVKAFGKYGLIDKAGNEVIPCKYDDISYMEDAFGQGYALVFRDGKAGYVNMQGEEVTEFKYGSGNVKGYSAPFTDLEDLTGKRIVISAAVGGELPNTYDSVSYSGYTCPILGVQNGNAVGIVDMYGNEVIPLDGSYESFNHLSFSQDGTLVVAYEDYHLYKIYNVAHDAPTAAEPAAGDQMNLDRVTMMSGLNGPTVVEGANAPADAPAAAPVEKWACTNCLNLNEGNFCPNCGSPRPAAPVGCTGCGYVPEGDMPNFCPQCGTKFAQ